MSSDDNKLNEVTLASWLYVATDGLCDSAKERIRGEIEAHYTEAVAAHLAEGLSEPAAQTAALAELGKPKAAARRFRKRHLAEKEAKQIQSLVQRASEPLLSAETFHWNYLLLVGIAFLAWYISSGNFYARYVAISFLAIFAGFRLVPHLLFNWMPSGVSRLRGFAWCHLLATVGVFIAYCQCMVCVNHAPDQTLMTLWINPSVSLFVWWPNWNLPNLTMLRDTEMVADETQPKATASS